MVDELDRVLRTRLESMNLVLEGLQNLSTDVTAARQGLDDLNRKIDEMSGLLTEVTELSAGVQSRLETMTDAMERYESFWQDRDRVPAATLRAVQDDAHTLRSKLRELRSSLSLEASKAVRELRRWSTLSESKIELDRELATSARKLVKTVAEAEQQAEPWPHYWKNVQGKCDDLFAQYVDLVGGVALRDHGLDRRVSRYADALVGHLLESFGKVALTLPSRHSPQALIQAQHVRIPLPPGWTLWSLPLAARGAGELLHSVLTSVPEPDLLPDVFGTYVLGPAYAFAAVLFEYDPRSPQDQRRALAVLDVLRRLDEQDDNRRFTTLASEIRSEWDAASAAGPLATAGPPEVPALDAVFDSVASKCGNAAYIAADRWDRVETLAADLGRQDGPVDATDLRDVLNAMWLERWLHPDLFDVVDRRATHAANAAVNAGGDHGVDRRGAGGRMENVR